MNLWHQEASMQWADLADLLKPYYLEVSAALLRLEQTVRQEGFPQIGTINHVSRRIEYPWAFSVLQPFFKEDDRDIVLEAGAGRTLLQALIAQRVRQVVSLDLWPDIIPWIQKALVEDWKLPIVAVQGDINCLDYPDNHFDKVVCISTLEHMPKFQEGIDELVRVTKPGGHLAITMDVGLGDARMKEPCNLVKVQDIVQLGQRYGFQVPPFPYHMLAFQNDCCLLTSALIHIKKGWKVGDWDRGEDEGSN